MLAVADEFLKWAERHEINARHWIIARHDAIKWCRRIPLKDLPLSTESAFRISYDEWIAGKLAALDQEVEDRKSVVSDTNRVSDLTMLGEAAKAAFAEEPEVCMGSALTLTGGWNPKSNWCQDCTLGADCRKLLTLGVQARRQNARC